MSRYITGPVTAVRRNNADTRWIVGINGSSCTHTWAGVGKPALGELVVSEYVPDEWGALWQATRDPDACVDCSENIQVEHGRCGRCAVATAGAAS